MQYEVTANYLFYNPVEWIIITCKLSNINSFPTKDVLTVTSKFIKNLILF